MFSPSSYQTLLSVIITLAIVCLFASKNDGGSFIFQIVNVMGKDLLGNINRESQNIKDEVSKKRSELYSKHDLIKKAGDKSPLSYLYGKCGNNAEILKKLSDTDLEVETINREILAYADTIYGYESYGRKHIESFSSERYEPQFMAFFVLLVSIIVLLVTVLPIPLEYSTPFIFFFNLQQFVFSFVIWLNYFKHSPKKDEGYKRKRTGILILIGLIALFLPSFVFALFMFLPFEGLAVFMSIASYLMIVFLVSLCMFHRCWHKHEHSRIVILKHLFYFCVACVVGCIVLRIFALRQDQYFIEHFDCLFQPQIAYAAFSILLLLNLIFIPLYGGYLHMKLEEIRSRRKLRKSIADKNQKLLKALDSLEQIIVQILSTTE